MHPTHSLSPSDTLRSLQDAISAEHNLIAGRVTWYVTSQAFLLTAYATSWNHGFGWPLFFHQVLPMAAIALSAVIYASIYAATWAQDVYLREQAHLINELKAGSLSDSERLALTVYERTTVSRRTNAAGKVVGGRIHAMVRVTPLLLPLGFTVMWLYAFWFAPIPT